MISRGLRLAGGVCCLLACAASSVGASQDAPPDREIWEKSQSLRPEPSTDTKRVLAKVGNALYRIPRNYVWNLHFTFPVLRVTYPGFEPLTEETRECFDPGRRVEAGCTSLELHLRLSLPDKKPGFENLLKLVPSEQKLSPRRSPDGYDVYDLGPEDARIEIYRSESEDIFFTCKIFNNNGKRDAVCDDAVSLPDGNGVWFFFRLGQISEIRAFEAGTRRLMSQFVAGERK